jgi:hypothetical protein
VTEFPATGGLVTEWLATEWPTIVLLPILFMLGLEEGNFFLRVKNIFKIKYPSQAPPDNDSFRAPPF